MRKKIPYVIAFCAVLAFSLLGLSKLRFETDILEVLPQGLPSVETLKISQKYFDNDQRIALLLTGEEEIFEEDVEDFAHHLRKNLDPAKIEFRSSVEENPQDFAKTLAALWLISPPDQFAELQTRLNDPERFAAHLSEVKEEIRSSFDQQGATMAAYDPMGFFRHPFIESLTDSELSFQSEDGKSQIILIHNPEPTTSYQAHQLWIDRIREAANSWSGLEEFGLNFGLTGGPVYNAEIGGSMESDMSGTIAITSALVGLLFLLVQRHPGQLFMILLLLGLSFLITLGIGGWIFGKLNLVSVGFATILLGLIIDYGVVILRESMDHESDPGSLRKSLAPGIFWAAATTAIVFGLLSLSTFQGVRQLGGLIIIGLITGSLVMVSFVPSFLSRFPSKPAKVLLRPPFPGKRIAGSLLGLIVLLAAGIFAIKGEPEISFDFSMVEPSTSEAAATFAKIQDKFPAWSERNIQLVATGDSPESLQETALGARAALEKLKEEGVVEHFQWPVAAASLLDRKVKNRSVADELYENREHLLQMAQASGFTDEGLALDRMVLDELAKKPDLTSLDELLEAFLARGEDGENYLSGSVMLREEVSEESLKTLDPLFQKNLTPSSWSIIQAALLPSVRRDFFVIFLPATGVLLLTLVAVFRSARDAAITISVLICSLLLVNAFVVISGSSWNFLSGMAIPLIVGTGIDYSIHLIYSLRRSGGDFRAVWNGVGKGICFCGLSTAVGFGSLLFASNEILRSMGLLCSIGVLTTMLLSVFVVPSLWKRRRH